MKKFLTAALAFVLILVTIPQAFAASPLSLTFRLTCDDAVSISDGDTAYKVTVPTGAVVTVKVYLENEANDEFSLYRLQNEVYYDHEFFEFVAGSVSTDTNCSGDMRVYSDGEHRVFINTIDTKNYEANGVVATFRLKVLEDKVGAYSDLATKLPKASDGDNNEVENIGRKNLRVEVGEPVDSYTLTYIIDDKTEKDTFAKGSVTNLRPAPEKEGYKFVGWESDGKTYAAGSEYTADKSATFTAKFEAKKRYALSFDANGGKAVPSVTLYEGEEYAVKQTTTRSGYTFDGWYTDKTFHEKVTVIKLDKDTVLYAGWTKNSTGGGGGGGGGGVVVNNVTLTFETNGGSEIKPVSVAVNTNLSLAQYVPVKEGSVFSGWCSDEKLTNIITSIKLTENTKIYAKWAKKSESGSAGIANRPSVFTTEHYAYIVGRGEGMVYPQANITRAEVATIFFRILNDETRSANLTKTNTFADVNEDNWFNTAVSTLASMGIIKGRSETEFDPNAYITRAEFATIAARFSDKEADGVIRFDDITGHWAEDYINRAATLGWVVGDGGKFRPNDSITRAEAMTLINRVLVRQPESEKDLAEGMKTWKDNPSNMWFYLAVQEATNSHTYEMKSDDIHEHHTGLAEDKDWTSLEK